MRLILAIPILFFLFLLFSVSPVQAATYYVSTQGSDSNNGTQGSPFKSFQKSVSSLNPGDTLTVEGGTYTDKLDLTKSGAAASPINIRAASGQIVILDARTTLDAPLSITGNYWNIEGLTVKNGSFDCVLIRGNNVKINKFKITGCKTFAIRMLGDTISLENSEIFENVTENTGGTNTSGGWGATVKTGPGAKNLVIKNNHVYNNWGEGMGLGRAEKVHVVGNRVHDNYSVNIYVDNSFDFLVEKNMVYSNNPKYYRAGNPANCIQMADENFADWGGARLARIKIINNIAAFCKRGIGYTYSELSNGGMDSSIIAFNTIWGSTDSSIVVINAPAKTRNSIIANNIVQQPQGRVADIKVSSGIQFYNNFWVNPVNGLGIAAGSGDKTGDVKLVGNPDTAPNSYLLHPQSPALNAGKTIAGITDDFLGLSRDGSPDIGAYEVGAGGPTSSNPTPTTPAGGSPTHADGKPGDANGDGSVDGIDYTIWLNHYNSNSQGMANGDFDGNGFVDGIDYTIWLNNYNR